jgi:transposase
MYNAVYSPQFNPIEGLWAWAKRIFARHCITGANFNSKKAIRRLVTEAIYEVPDDYLRNRIRRAVDFMKAAVAEE